MAPTPDPNDVRVDTDDLRDYSQQMYNESVSFGDSWLNQAGFNSAAQAQTNGHTVDPNFIGPVTSQLPAAITFWGTHRGRVTELQEFDANLVKSLQAIAAASGAIKTAYDTQDEVNADSITSRSSFFRSEVDSGDGTLEWARRQPPS